MAIIGTPDADYIPGTDDADEIYGYDPDVGEGGLGIYALRLNTGLEQPTYVTSAPNDPYRLYVLEKTGLIKMMSRVTGDIESTPVLDLRGQIDTEGEQGLVGLAFHPQFGQNGNNKVYVTLSNLEGKTELREYSLTNGMIDPDSMRLVLRINEYTEQSSLHRGGWIGFGPDGYLYMTTGEGNQFAVAQDPNSLLGKVLRIDVDGADAYPDDDDKNFAIPDTNPTAFDGVNGTFAQSAVYAIGFRNPWRASFDSKGRMFIGDVGENEYEEINLLKAGANYGWGHHDANDDGPEDPAGPYTNPINHYYHGPGQNDGIGASVTGGYVYEGPIEALKGHYIFGDFMSGKLLSLHQDANGNWIRTDLTGLLTGGATGSLGMISSFGQDADGNIYAMDYATGSIYRLMPQVLDLGDTIEGGKGDDTIRGGGGDDSIDGGDDNDRLYGDAGADTLIGGSGNDLYYVDGHDTIVETANNGFDRVYTSESFALQADHSIEFLSTADQNGTTAINLTGNGFSQDLIGNAGANRLDGGGGEDTLRGLGGNDTYLVDGNDTIVEQEDGGIDTVEALVDNYSLGDHLENLTLRGNAVKGTGNALANILTGNALANILDGVGGADTLAGGLGNDTYMADANDSIVEQMNGGIDTVEALVDNYSLGDHLENLTLRGNAVKGTGNALANILTGNALANILDGAGGADTLAGGLGNDTYIVDDGSEVIVETSGQGTETVVTSASYALGDGADVEILQASGTSAIDLTGNALSNTLIGNIGANHLFGGNGNDALTASSGNDSLIGGSGTDTLTGGSGKDVFAFDDRETSSSKSKADTIADFSGRGGDKIDLRAIDANTKKIGDQNFAFIGKKAFSKAGEVRYEKTKGYTYVYLNTDSDKAAEAVIKLKGSLDLSKGWFVL